MDKKLFDVIIVNYNSTSHLKNNIAALLKCDLNDRINIFVQDNASSEDVAVLKQRFPSIHLALNKKNIGFGAAVNRAAEQGSAPYVVLINPDAFVENYFFTIMLAYLRENRDIGILGPKILNFDGSLQGSARAFPNLLTFFFGRNSYLTKIFPNNIFSRANILNSNGNSDHCMTVDWVSGACMIIRRQVLTQIGFFDESFFMYWEDADLCRRAWKKGWKVVYFPKAVAYHQVGQSSKTNPYLALLHFHKSCFRLFVKYSNWYHIPFYALVLSTLMLRFALVAGKMQIEKICSRQH